MFFSLFLTFFTSVISNCVKESQGSLLFLALFNFQGAVFCYASARQLFHYITFQSFCQVLFSSFFQILFHVIAAPLRCSFSIISQLFDLVNTFSKVFSKSFSLWSVPLRTALILYHFQIALSSAFPKLFFAPPGGRFVFYLAHLTALLL